MSYDCTPEISKFRFLKDEKSAPKITMLCADLENDMKGYLLLHKYTSSICMSTATLAHISKL